MAVITFKGYRVLHLSYESKHRSFNSEIKYQPQFDYHIKIKEENNTAILTLQTLVDQDFPFKVEASVEGSFSYQPDEDKNDHGFQFFLETNAIAILYPYLRSLVSLITTNSNEFPALILPTINVPKLIEKKHRKNHS